MTIVYPQDPTNNHTQIITLDDMDMCDCGHIRSHHIILENTVACTTPNCKCNEWMQQEEGEL